MKKSKFLISGIVFAFTGFNLVFMHQSCSYNQLEEPKEQSAAFCDSVDATYSGSVKAIIASECATPGCHNAGFTGANFTTYNGVKVHVDDGHFKQKVFDTSTMPPSGFINAKNKDILKCWLDQGALNN